MISAADGDLIEIGAITHLATNGAGCIHDFELALIGETSEDVADSIETGLFGMAEETGRALNAATAEAAASGFARRKATSHMDAIAGHLTS